MGSAKGASRQQKLESVARARLFRHRKPESDPASLASITNIAIPDISAAVNSHSDVSESFSESAASQNLVEECAWDGTVNNDPLELNGEDAWDSDVEDFGMFQDLEGEESNQAVEAEMTRRVNILSVVNAYDELGRTLTKKDWKKAEKGLKMRSVYTGKSQRSERRHNLNAKRKNAADTMLSETAEAEKFRTYFSFKPNTPRSRSSAPSPVPDHTPIANNPMRVSESTTLDLTVHARVAAQVALDFESNPSEVFLGYASDIESDEPSSDEPSSDDSDSGELVMGPAVFAPPRLKRQRLDVSVKESRKLKRKKRLADWELSLKNIGKVIISRRYEFAAGDNGLQARRARAIQSYLHMVVQNGRKKIDASQRAAESQRFAPSWGGRMVRKWAKAWIDLQELPRSTRGCHAKAFSLLEDPVIRAELRSWLRTNKWAMNPQKLASYTQTKVITPEVQKYVQDAVEKEMPRGLVQYIDTVLFPRIQLKVVRSISLRTAQRWLHAEGFRYEEHRKALYYDGHERPDVKEYCNKKFLPEMKELEEEMVEYVVGEVEKEVEKDYSGRKVVLCAHDEMTAQANDGTRREWVLNGDFKMRKKGAGRGVHRSDVICSTVGWLKDAGQEIEYGKNYDGYWTGEMFVKQLKEKIIPAFEAAHDPREYQALIMVDNSQGHSAYAKDALLTSRMNFNPGGKQAIMRDSWYYDQTGQKIIQKMVLASGEAKGMKMVIQERGLWKAGLKMSCSDQQCAANERTDCCCKRILDLQPDFQAQTSLVQETIQDAGHLCIFLPKFHCELNFIEFFWGAVKKYLRDNCDYTFDGLKRNMPLALASVSVYTIRKWEHRMKRWMEAYRGGLGVKEAQFQVRAFSSKKYKSHRRVSETVARQFDTL